MTERRRVTLVSSSVDKPIENHVAYCRHQQDIAIVGNPGPTQMCVAKTIDDVVGVMIAGAPIPTTQASVRTELDHAKGHRHAGERVSVPARADEGIDIVYR